MKNKASVAEIIADMGTRIYIIYGTKKGYYGCLYCGRRIPRKLKKKEYVNVRLEYINDEMYIAIELE